MDTRACHHQFPVWWNHYVRMFPYSNSETYTFTDLYECKRVHARINAQIRHSFTHTHIHIQISTYLTRTCFHAYTHARKSALTHNHDYIITIFIPCASARSYTVAPDKCLSRVSVVINYFPGWYYLPDRSGTRWGGSTRFVSTPIRHSTIRERRQWQVTYWSLDYSTPSVSWPSPVWSSYLDGEENRWVSMT